MRKNSMAYFPMLLIARESRWIATAMLAVIMLLYSPGECIECTPEDSFDEENKWLPCEITDKNVTFGEDGINTDVNFQSNELKLFLPVRNMSLDIKVHLRVIETITTPEQCNSVSKPAYASYSTTHTFNFIVPEFCVQDKKGLNASGPWVGSTTFKFLFTGCYWFVITYPDVDVPINSIPRFYKTNYSKRLIGSMDYDLAPQFHKSPDGELTKSLKLVIGHEAFSIDKVPLQMSLQKTMNNECNDEEMLAYWELSLMDDDTLVCKVKNDPKYQNTSSIDCQLEDYSKVSCWFYNIPYDHLSYCITMNPVDIYRCNFRTLWDDTCKLEWQINDTVVTSVKSSVLVPDDTWSVGETTRGIGLVSCFFIMVVAAVLVHKIRSHRVPTVCNHPPKHNLLSQPQILLLYAQSCPKFMTLMKSFRELLEKVGHFEVLDCFDPNRDADVAKNPVGWMNYWTTHPDVKVIVVGNDCAVAHQKAMMSGISLQYQAPECYSHLFTFGLHMVTNNLQREAYNYTFVVRFDDYDLSYLTPYTRYKLPEHLLDLLKSLNPSIDLTKVDGSKEHNILMENHYALMAFQQKHPHYVKDAMFKLQADA